MKKKNAVKRMYFIAVAACILSLLALVSVTLAWLNNTRELDTLTWIKTPVMLDIGSGNNHDISLLDMGDIDSSQGNERTYVFCVYGQPVDLYSLQLAYTTNIAFYYDVYRADYNESGSGAVEFTYTDGSGAEHTEFFDYHSSTPVIAAKPLSELTNPEEHQSHSMSYGDDNGKNPIDTNKVQSNAEPLYWLASEDDLMILNPVNTITDSDDELCFCDYFIIKVHWDEGTVVNDKETDMVYLIASK